MTEPTYHCKRCEREGITDQMVSWRRHQEWKNQRSANIIAVVIVAVMVLCVAGGLAVFG
jgi:hypothetical protein